MSITFQQPRDKNSSNLPMRLRSDLEIRPQHSMGRRYWVIKEPLGLKYFRFQDEEYALLKMLDGSNSLEWIRDQYEKNFAPRKLRLEALQRFIGRLHEKGLLLVDLPGQGKKLKRLGDQARRMRRRAALSNVLAIRFPGFDPDRLLTKLNRYTWPIFSPAVFCFVMLFALSALVLVTIHFDTFLERLPAASQFYGPANIHWLMLSLIACKIIHEFGHGLACKHFGGECHKMGFMLLVFMPVMYCDVSDSWLLSNKWKRIAIGAAGIYLEIFIASLATFGWWFSEPGLVNSICLSVIFLTSVSTLVVNANPLMRFDGYFILSDLLEIPNLAGKSSNTLRNALTQLLTGIDLSVKKESLASNRRWLMSYAIASTIYRWGVLLAILFFLNSLLEPYGLQILSNLLAGVGIFGFAVAPAWRLGKVLRVPGMTSRMNPRRVQVTSALLLLAILVVVFLPLPYSIYGDGYVALQDAKTVYVAVPGKLETIHAIYGERVKKEDPIATLVNPQIEFAIAELEGQAEALKSQLKGLRKTRLVSNEARISIHSLEETLEAVRQQLKNRKSDQTELVRHASRSGHLLASPTLFHPTQFQEVAVHLQASPLDKQSLGRHLRAGDFLCQIGDPQMLELIIFIGQEDIHWVRNGAQVEAYFASLPLQSVSTELAELSRAESGSGPLILATSHGGRVVMQSTPQGLGKTVGAIYQARAPIDNSDLRIRPGVRCRVRIQTEAQTLGQRLLRWVRSTFRFKWQTGEAT